MQPQGPGPQRQVTETASRPSGSPDTAHSPTSSVDTRHHSANRSHAIRTNRSAQFRSVGSTFVRAGIVSRKNSASYARAPVTSPVGAHPIPICLPWIGRGAATSTATGAVVPVTTTSASRSNCHRGRCARPSARAARRPRRWIGLRRSRSATTCAAHNKATHRVQTAPAHAFDTRCGCTTTLSVGVGAWRTRYWCAGARLDMSCWTALARSVCPHASRTW